MNNVMINTILEAGIKMAKRSKQRYKGGDKSLEAMDKMTIAFKPKQKTPWNILN